jgi:hypothetical protein
MLTAAAMRTAPEVATMVLSVSAADIATPVVWSPDRNRRRRRAWAATSPPLATRPTAAELPIDSPRG